MIKQLKTNAWQNEFVDRGILPCDAPYTYTVHGIADTCESIPSDSDTVLVQSGETQRKPAHSVEVRLGDLLTERVGKNAIVYFSNQLRNKQQIACLG